MTAPVFRPRAVRDIGRIWDYTAEHWGTAQADRYIGAIRDVCDALAAGDATGTSAAYIGPGDRRIRSGRHIVFLLSPALRHRRYRPHPSRTHGLPFAVPGVSLTPRKPPLPAGGPRDQAPGTSSVKLPSKRAAPSHGKVVVPKLPVPVAPA